MLITSLENDRVKGYIKLKERKYRKKTKTFIVEGVHSVLEAYKNGDIIELILEKDETLDLNVPIIYVTNEIINKISSLDTPSKIMALCKMRDCDSFNLGSKILMLDGIQDPGNLGTIVRSATAFGIDSIVLSPDTVDIYNPKVLRSTQGMIFHIPIIVKELDLVVKELKSNNIPIYGTRVDSGEDVSLLTKSDKDKYALIMGNEGNGVKEELLDECDKYLYIDMDNKVESLNVAVACGIILYELNK